MPTTQKSRYKRGTEAYRQHLGREYEPASSPHDPPSMKDLSALGMERCYGDSWSRPGLDMKTKSFITMTLCATLGVDNELKTHIAAAHNVGVTKDEIVEWLIHLYGYIGAPRSTTARRIAREVWAKMAEAGAPRKPRNASSRAKKR